MVVRDEIFNRIDLFLLLYRAELLNCLIDSEWNQTGRKKRFIPGHSGGSNILRPIVCAESRDPAKSSKLSFLLSKLTFETQSKVADLRPELENCNEVLRMVTFSIESQPRRWNTLFWYNAEKQHRDHRLICVLKPGGLRMIEKHMHRSDRLAASFSCPHWRENLLVWLNSEWSLFSWSCIETCFLLFNEWSISHKKQSCQESHHQISFTWIFQWYYHSNTMEKKMRLATLKVENASDATSKLETSTRLKYWLNNGSSSTNL